MLMLNFKNMLNFKDMIPQIEKELKYGLIE